VVVLLVGSVYFAATQALWVPPLTLASYGALVYLAARSPSSERPGKPRPRAPEAVPPDVRARRLPGGETREKVEAALEGIRRVTVAVEGSGEETQGVLGDVTPKLERIAQRIVEVAEEREKAAEALRLPHGSPRPSTPSPERGVPVGPAKTIREADAELAATVEQLSALRAKVLRVSIESGPYVQSAADDLHRDLDTLHRRLQTLR
jgi:hypothetical protein